METKDKNPFKKESKQGSVPPKTANRALSHDQIHGNDKFNDTLQQTELTKAYSIAEQKLRTKPYAELKFKTKEKVINIRGFYPYLSVALSLSVGIMTGDLFASGMSEMGYYLTLGLLTLTVFLVAWLLEDLKRDACRELFEKDVKQRTGKQKFWVNSLFAYSLIISGIGGYVASIHLNDRTAEIEQNYQFQSDSVSSNLSPQIALLNDVISENQKRIKSRSKWTRYHAQKDLSTAQGQKTELLKLQNNTLSEIKTEKKAEIKAMDLINQYKAYVIVLVVLLLESLYIRSFAYEYAVERNIKSENRNHGFVPPSEETQDGQYKQALTLQEVAMQMLVENLISQGGIQTLAQNSVAQNQIIPDSQENTVGFQFRGNVSPNIQSKKYQSDKPQKDKYRNCKCCGTEFEFKHWNKQYCSDSCKKMAWEKRQNKK